MSRAPALLPIVLLILTPGGCGGEMPERHVAPPPQPQSSTAEDVPIPACESDGMPADLRSERHRLDLR